MYDEDRRNVNDFRIPCVLSAGSGQYIPLQGLKSYTVPVYLECWGYACLDGETPAPPFTEEEQKESLNVLVEALNGTTQVIDGSVVVFTGTTVTVGTASDYSGCGYTRLPFLVQMTLTAIDGAVLFNDVEIKLNNQRLFFTSFSVGFAREGKSVTAVGTSMAKTNCEQQARTFTGVALIPKIEALPLMGALYTEILDVSPFLNPTYRLTIGIDGREYNYTVVIINASIGGQMGGVMQLNLTMAEAWTDE